MISANQSDHEQDLVVGCPEYTSEVYLFLEHFAFWTDGVIKTAISILGILGNLIAAYILTRPSMKNSFNILLVTLGFIDAFYLFAGILEAFRREFHLGTNMHNILFVYVFYPLSKIALTASIFMTVAISLERYVAVYYPLDFNLAMNDKSVMRRRLLSYLVPVAILSMAFNATKFLEAKIDYKRLYPESNITNPADMHWIPEVSITELRTNPIYSSYSNWSRLLILGIVPFLALVIFNWKILQSIQERRRRRHPNSCTATGAGGNRSRHSVTFKSKSGGQPATAIIKSVPGNNNASVAVVTPPEEAQESSPNGSEGRQQSKENLLDASRRQLLDSPATLKPQSTTPESNGNGFGSSSLSPSESNLSAVNTGRRMTTETLISNNSMSSHITTSTKLLGSDDDRRLSPIPSRSPSPMAAELPSNITGNQMVMVSASRPGRVTVVRPDITTRNEKRRRLEENLALVCMAYTLVFLLCNSLRIFMDCHELYNLSHANRCKKEGIDGIPPWSRAAVNVSHVLLAVNSSINIMIYSILSSKFREEFAIVLKKFACCVK